MDLTVQAQLLGALQREGLCQTPCRSGEPHSPHPAPTHPHGPKEELSLLQQFGATTRYSQYEENTQKGALCSVRSAIGTLQANLGDFLCTAAPPHFHRPIMAVGQIREKQNLCMQDSPDGVYRQDKRAPSTAKQLEKFTKNAEGMRLK